jgi:hypothetical protein
MHGQYPSFIVCHQRVVILNVEWATAVMKDTVDLVKNANPNEK